MAYGTGIITSLFGRRVGLQSVSSGQSNTQTAGRKMEFMVGPDDFRVATSTAETTASSLAPFGVSMLSSANTGASGAVMKLDAPIPGVEKTIVVVSTAATVASTIAWVIRASDAGANFQSSWSSSFTTLTTSSPCVIKLIGVTTASWGLMNSSAIFSAASTT